MGPIYSAHSTAFALLIFADNVSRIGVPGCRYEQHTKCDNKQYPNIVFVFHCLLPEWREPLTLRMMVSNFSRAIRALSWGTAINLTLFPGRNCPNR